MYFNIIDGRKHEPKAFTNANLSSISNATIKIVDWGRFDRIQVDLPDHDWFQYLRVNGRADEIEALAEMLLKLADSIPKNRR